jgi:hypothetical protein
MSPTIRENNFKPLSLDQADGTKEASNQLKLIRNNTQNDLLDKNYVSASALLTHGTVSSDRNFSIPNYNGYGFDLILNQPTTP